ncbi:MAG: hypothetical protein M1828_007147 [Chrysothrix sp. TS-e1954]|nr:MAG: hypothetical protein M1828_007147 [Chrysothrix sp. TS-e1954]
MACTLRRPFAIPSNLKQISKPGLTTVRAFHPTPLHAKPQPQSLFSKTRQNAFLSAFRSSPRRSYQQAAPSLKPAEGPSLNQRLLIGAGLFGGTLLAINLVFNRETRDDGGMPPFERSYLNDTFLHTGLGLGTIAVGARAMYTNGLTYRLMGANPWLVMGVGLASSIGFMIGARATAPENYIPKYALWTGFNLTQAALLSPLMFLQPALLARAGLYTVAMMGSISIVGATAKQDKYLYLGGPLLAGVAIVAVSGFAPLVLPATAVRTLAVTENLWLYGGLAVFGGFTLYDIQKILNHARAAEMGMMKRDPVNESIGLELDFINIFVRMVQILGMQQRRK